MIVDKMNSVNLKVGRSFHGKNETHYYLLYVEPIFIQVSHKVWIIFLIPKFRLL